MENQLLNTERGHDVLAKIVPQELNLQLLQKEKTSYLNYKPESIMENTNFRLVNVW